MSSAWSLYNRARETKTSQEREIDIDNHGIAFAVLMSYFEEVRMDSLVASVFKLTNPTNVYSTRLEQFGTKVTGCVHSTKLKNRILAYFPDMEAHKRGREVVLACNEDVRYARRIACELDADNDAVHLARAANIIRRDILRTKMKVNGSFDTKGKESVSVSLVALGAMVLNSPNIKTQSRSSCVPKPTLTLI